MKDIKTILDKNPAIAREIAKLLREELDMDVEQTDLTLPQVPAGTNDGEVVPEAPGVTPDVADVNGDGHSVDLELTAEDPVTPEQIEQMVDEIEVEDLPDEADALEDAKEEDEKEVEELDKVIEEATKLRDSIAKRIVFTESVINKVNARMLTEAAKVLASKKSLTEGKK